MNRFTPLALLAFTLVAVPVWAQTAAAPRTATLGSGTSSAALLTREELRACLKRQAEFAPRRQELEAQSSPLTAEKTALLQEMEALKLERQKIGQISATIKDYAARRSALSARVAEYNARAKDLDDARGRMTAAEMRVREQNREALLREQEGLQRENQALDAERAQFSGQEEMVRVYNARATAQDRRVDDWNARNERALKAQQIYQTDHEAWSADCATRRYREDDEDAIRRGQ